MRDAGAGAVGTSARADGVVRPRGGAPVLAASVLLLAVGSGPRPVVAQDPQEHAATCAAASAPGSALYDACFEAALALRSVVAGVGVLASGGSALAGSSTTLGKRFGGSPRIALGLRGRLARVPTVDPESGGAALDGATFSGFALEASVAAGLFDGFSWIPTVGGILAVDVVGTATRVFLPEGRGFEGNAHALGLGLRVGLLRESFTVPGVTLSATRRALGDVAFGTPGRTPVYVTASPDVTSYRAVVGKDLYAVGVLAGLGWDRYGGEATLAARSADGAAASATLEDVGYDRRLLFGGLSVTYLVLQLSAEVGWTSGFDALPGRPSPAYDPSARTFFLAVAARLYL